MQNNSSTFSTLQRQWHLLKLLPTKKPGVTTSDLLNTLNDLGYAVKKRQLERDMQMLSTLFPIQCNDKSKPFGWYWSSSCQLPSMTIQEAMSYELMAPTLKGLLPAPLLQLLAPRLLEAKKLISLAKEKNATAMLSQKLAVIPTGNLYLAPQVDNVIFDTVQEALLHGKCIEVEYHQAYRNTTKLMTLHPLALVQNGIQLYIVAVVDGYTDPRIFALHRIKQIHLMSKESQNPINFNLKEFIETGAFQFLQGATIDLVAKVSASLATVLKETPISKDMTINEDNGHYLVRAHIEDSWQFHRWLLSQGANIQVQEPAELRAKIVSQLQAAISGYELS